MIVEPGRARVHRRRNSARFVRVRADLQPADVRRCRRTRGPRGGIQATHRCIAFRTAEGVQLQSRQLRPLTRYVPEVAAGLVEQTCAARSATHTPGSSATAKVETPNMNMHNTRTFFRPCVSPQCPSTNAQTPKQSMSARFPPAPLRLSSSSRPTGRLRPAQQLHLSSAIAGRRTTPPNGVDLRAPTSGWSTQREACGKRASPPSDTNGPREPPPYACHR